jgi:hypothetical protein
LTRHCSVKYQAEQTDTDVQVILSRLRKQKLFRKAPCEADVVGSLDTIADGTCYGWAVVPGTDNAIEIGIAVDGTVMAGGLADRFRQDLHEAGHGSGNHAFVIELPASVRDSRFHSISAIANGRVFAHRDEVQLLPKLTPDQFERHAPWLDTDESKFETELEQRIANGEVSSALAPELRFFRENGYVCLSGAIPIELIDRALEDVERSWEILPDHLLVLNSSMPAPAPIASIAQTNGFRSSSFRYLDFHNWSEAAAAIMMHSRVLEFVRTYLDSEVVAMQSLLFENGTEQRGHQDFAFVHSLKPALLAGAWVALEDVQPESGPLFYYPGSHRLIAKHVFENGTVLAESDGPHIRAFEEYLEGECERLGLERVVFTPRKGDVLIWHSALVHGGSRRADPALTRKSMVSHYSTRGAYPFDRRHPAAKPAVISRDGGSYYALQREGHREGLFSL